MYRKTFTAEDPALPMHYPNFIFRSLRDEGHDTNALLTETGLTEERLENPNFRSDFWSLRRFVKNALELTGDPHLGSRLALKFEPNYIGLPAYAALNAKRFQDGLEVLNRYFFLTFPVIEFTFPDSDAVLRPGEAAIRLRSKFELGDIGYFAFSSALVVCEGLCAAMLRRERVAARAEMAISEPEGWAKTASNIGFDVRFDASEHRLMFPAEILTQPLPGADPINHLRLLKLCEQFSAAAEFETTMVSQVVAFLEAEQNLGAALTDAAAALGYSERGLRRQLQRSGVSYRKLVDALREKRARELLANSAQPIQAIAYDLGFDTPSNFARSFKRWTGVTPRAFRERRTASADIGRN